MVTPPTQHPQPPQGMAYLLAMWRHVFTKLQDHQLYREYPPPEAPGGAHTTLAQLHPSLAPERLDAQSRTLAHTLLEHGTLADPYNFNTNDYLGIQRSGISARVDAQLAETLPIGALSSRLVGGDHPIFTVLETTIAELTGFECALYFSSGMVLNLALPSFIHELARRADSGCPSRLSFLSDAHNHASTIAGMQCAPSIAKVIFQHLDWNAPKLCATLNNPHSWCDFIFTEGLYSMAGDAPSSAAIAARMQTAPSAVLVLDEAHSFGTHHDGCFMQSLLHHDPQLNHRALGIYPMGKAMGGSGALLCGSTELMRAVWNLCRPFIYTTAPSPLVAGALLLRLKMNMYLDKLRERLSRISHELSHRLRAFGFPLRGAGSPFLIITLGSAQRAVHCAEYLQSRGILTTAIRYPTVPHQHSCLRLSLHPFLHKQHLDTVVKAFDQAAAHMSRYESPSP